MNIIEMLVVLFIFSVLIFSFVKHIELAKEMWNLQNTSYGKKNNMIFISMNSALFGIILFYSLNVLTALELISISFLSSNVSALGAFISFIIYIVSRIKLTSKNFKCTKL